MEKNEVYNEIIEAIGNLNDKYDALMIDFLLFKQRYELQRANHSFARAEASEWSDWARRLITALITAIATVVGIKLTGGI